MHVVHWGNVHFSTIVLDWRGTVPAKCMLYVDEYTKCGKLSRWGMIPVKTQRLSFLILLTSTVCPLIPPYLNLCQLLLVSTISPSSLRESAWLTKVKRLAWADRFRIKLTASMTLSWSRSWWSGISRQCRFWCGTTRGWKNGASRALAERWLCEYSLSVLLEFALRLQIFVRPFFPSCLPSVTQSRRLSSGPERAD